MKTTTNRFGSRRGNAVLEFALSSLVLVPLMLGTFQFGYTFYVYNLLNSQIRAGARYASIRTFRCANNSSITTFQTKVKNMVVYGNTDGTGSVLVPGMTTARVDVQIKDQNGASADSTHIPSYVVVSSLNFPLDAVFTTYTFNGKPSLRFPYSGQFAPQDTE